MKILILNGHDNYGNGGASNASYGTEQGLTREFASYLKKAFIKQGINDITIFNPTIKDKSMYSYLSSGKSFDFTRFSNVIELHFNACVNDLKGNGIQTGTEILIHKEESSKLEASSHILDSLQVLGMKNRGVKRRSDLLVMNSCKKQNVDYLLWEICFIDDRDDMEFYIKNKQSMSSTFVKEYIKHKKNNAVRVGYVDTTYGVPLRVRANAGTEHTIVSKLNHKEKIYIFQSVTSNTGELWYQVGVTQSIPIGYCHSEFIKL